MLSKPDIGSKEHVLTWLDMHDPDEHYEWLSGQCPAGQYSGEFGDEHTGLNLDWINSLAKIGPHTWGALSKRAEKC